MKKFLKQPKRTKLTDEQKIEMAEMKLTEKINSMADFIESNKDWNYFDLYCILKFHLDNTIIPNLEKNKKSAKMAKTAYKAIEIREENYELTSGLK